MLACLLDHADEAPNPSLKIRVLISMRSGTQNASLVTDLLSLDCGAQLVESYCKE